MKDGVLVNVGDMELHEFNKLLEVAAEGLKRKWYGSRLSYKVTFNKF